MIRQRVLILGLAALLPAILLTIALAVLTLTQHQERMRDNAVGYADRLLGDVEDEFRLHVALLRVLAQSPALDAETVDLALFDDVARRFVAATPAWDRVILLSGVQQVVNTHVPFGTPLPTVVDTKGLAAVHETGRPHVGGLVRAGTYSPERSLVGIRIPILDGEGSIRFVLTAVVLAERLTAILQAAALPEAWRPIVVDADGIIVANPGSPERVGERLGELGIAARERSSGGVYDGRTAAGVPVVTAFRRSAETGWSAHVSIPVELYNSPLRRLMLLLAIGAVVAIGLSAVFAALLRREIVAGRREAIERERATRMAALGRLTGGVAHDFNNLLMIVLSSATMLEKRVKAPEATRYIDAIRKAGDRGAGITRQLLAFSRGDLRRADVIDVSERLRSLLGMFRQSLPPSVSLDAVVPSEPIFARIDPIEFDLALLNIVTNARDAMPDGGTLTITIRRDGTGRAGDERGIVVSIADTGAGIPPEALPHVFEPFYTTKEPGRGTGLGLAQVHGFATASRGSADVASEPGRGTIVTIGIPEERVVETVGVASGDEEAASSLPPGGRLLLIEDNEAIRTVTAEYLAHCGWTVIEAPDALLGRRLLETDAIDLVVSDIVMPGPIDGVELAQEIRRRWPQIPVLLVSGYSASARVAVDVDIEVLTKPYEFSALDAAIERARRRCDLANAARSAAAG
ncbi:ATP-binding protein [Salinarimonas sp.]|uniref:ATP-binding protein n=1 Tax=Salinarimonas sp. TaxID=2766526 RepID=UPI00391CF1F1